MARTTIKDLEARLDATLPALEERIETLEAENAKLRRLVEQNGTGKPRPPAPNARAARFSPSEKRAYLDRQQAKAAARQLATDQHREAAIKLYKELKRSPYLKEVKAAIAERGDPSNW